MEKIILLTQCFLFLIPYPHRLPTSPRKSLSRSYDQNEEIFSRD